MRPERDHNQNRHGPASPGGSPRKPRRQSWLRRWKSRLVTIWQGFTYRLYDWWHPISNSRHGYGGRRQSRWAQAWRAVKLWGNRLLIRLRKLTFADRLYDWWYPATEKQDRFSIKPISRPARMWRRLKQRLGRSSLSQIFFRKYYTLVNRIDDLWYGPTDHGGYGYGYGSGKTSRATRFLRRSKRRLARSPAGLWVKQAVARLDNWWYPPSDRPGGYGYSSGYGYGYGNARRNRLVRAWHRFHRRFRRTWLGSKVNWLLTDAAELLYYISVKASRHLSWNRLKPKLFRWQTIAGLAILLVTAGAGHRYGLPRLRLYQENLYAQQAQLWAAKGDFRRSMLRAHQALSLNQSNAVIARVFADMADSMGSPYALYWRERTQLLMPNPTNQLALASTALRTESFPYPKATKTLNSIELPFQRTAGYQRVAGALALKLADLKAAEKHYATALQLEPDNPVNRMSLAVVRLQTGDARLISDSRTTLELLRADQHLGLLAARSLVAESLNRQDFAQAENLSQQAINHEKSMLSDRIIHLAILQTRHSTNYAPFLAQTEQQCLTNIYQAGELATWLNNSGQAQQTLAWLGRLPERYTDQGFLPLAIADAYISQKKWTELTDYLQRKNWGEAEHIRLALMSLAASRRFSDQYGSVAWHTALENAARGPDRLNTLAKLTEAWGWPEKTEEVLWRAAKLYPKDEWPLSFLSRIYAARRDTRGLWRTAQAQLQQQPDETLTRNNYAMLSLLLNVDVTKAQELAAKLHATDPKNTVIASTYAFSLYTQGRNREAIGVLKPLGLEQLDNPSMAAYYGIFLAANGDLTTARHYLDLAAKAYLLPEESALVEKYKTRR